LSEGLITANTEIAASSNATTFQALLSRFGNLMLSLAVDYLEGRQRMQEVPLQMEYGLP